GIGGQARSSIAALDGLTGLATGWHPQSGGEVRTLAVDGGIVYAGGNFGSMSGQFRPSIAAIDATTGAV
ncbi:MAG: hypothetical protein ABI783_05740, partial [Actinomycetota bacterium]